MENFCRYELQAVPGFDATTIRKNHRSFVRVDGSDTGNLLKAGHFRA